MEVRVDGDDVDLADRWHDVVVDLRPAERGNATIDVVDAEPGRIEPRLTRPEAEGLARPAAVLRAVGVTELLLLSQVAVRDNHLAKQLTRRCLLLRTQLGKGDWPIRV